MILLKVTLIFEYGTIEVFVTTGLSPQCFIGIVQAFAIAQDALCMNVTERITFDGDLDIISDEELFIAMAKNL